MKTSDTINGKTPEEIKKGLMCYRGKHPFAIGHCPSGCPYEQYGTSCRDMMNTDALAYIHQLASRLAQTERERDAAVECIKNIDQILHKHVSTIVETANKVRSIQKVIADYVLSARRAVHARSKKEGEIK